MRKIPLIMPILAFLWVMTLPAQRGIQIVAITQTGESIELYSESYALVVGVSEYTDGWPELPNAVKDALDVKAELEKQGFVVTLMQNPSSSQLENGLKSFLASYGVFRDNRLLFYFAGHGHTIEKAYGGEVGYIVPADAPLPRLDKSGFLQKAISMESFNTYAKNVDAKHMLFLFDSCFSGSIFSLSRAAPDAISHKTSLPVRQFVTAGSEDEQVPDRSIFKEQFIEAIRGEADGDRDGYVTGTEMGYFLQTNVVNYSNNTQHPQFGKIRDSNLDKGDFVFVLRSSSQKPTEPTFSPDATGIDLKRFEDERDRIAVIKDQWARWQTNMSQAFQKINDLDKDENLQASSKAEMWKEFLTTYKDDNPYSQQDEELRQDALERKQYWLDFKKPFQISSPATEYIGETVTDIDGNVYKTVKIGNQVWMAENLKVTHYRNGDPIPNVTSEAQWDGLTTGAYCNYDNDTRNALTYGRLYNWFAAGDSRNIAPSGWHVPSDAEWKQLEMFLGMSQSQADGVGLRGTNEGGKLKEAGFAHWRSPNAGATNESGFTALPGGYRNFNEVDFGALGAYALLWSSTERNSDYAWYRTLIRDYAQIGRDSYSRNKRSGFSVRCVRD